MAFEELTRLEDQLDELQLRAQSLESVELRQRIIAFCKSVYDEIELAQQFIRIVHGSIR